MYHISVSILCRWTFSNRGFWRVLTWSPWRDIGDNVGSWRTKPLWDFRR